MQAAQMLAGYLARRSRFAAPRDGQEDPVGDGRPARPLRRGLRDRINQIPAAKANELFDTIDKFAGYGFNKSHAAAYALIAYQTAWLKAHHRAEFYAASMSFDMALTDKLGMFVEDMRRGAVECLPPDINASHAHFTVEDGPGDSVRYALGALKGVGEKAMEALVEERERRRAVREPRGFRRAHRPAAAQPPPARKPGRRGRVRRHQARSRRRCSLRPRRSSPMPRARTTSAPAARPACSGVNSAEAAPIRLPRDASWTLAQRMAAERDAFGFYFSAHPVDAASHLLAAHKVRTFAELADLRIAEGERAGATMAALVEGVRWRVVGQGPPLHDREPVGPLGPVRSDGVRRRAGQRARSRRQRRAAAGCSTSSSIGAPATTRRG